MSIYVWFPKKEEAKLACLGLEKLVDLGSDTIRGVITNPGVLGRLGHDNGLFRMTVYDMYNEETFKPGRYFRVTRVAQIRHPKRSGARHYQSPVDERTFSEDSLIRLDDIAAQVIADGRLGQVDAGKAALVYYSHQGHPYVVLK